MLSILRKKEKTGTEQEKSVMKRVLMGTVVSDKMNKTRVVCVDRQKQHPLYKKYFMVSKKYKAHDEANTYHTGDIVHIRQTRPLSKDKRWEIIGFAEGQKTKEKDTNQEISENSL